MYLNQQGGLGSFGALSWDTIFGPAGYNIRDNSWSRPRDWRRRVIEQLLSPQLLSHRPADFDEIAWTNAIPTMSCSQMTIRLGLGFDTGAICYRLGAVWPEVQQFVRDNLAAEEFEKWAAASCADRAPSEGGGSVCTAWDGAVRVRCWDDVDYTREPVILPEGSRCPAGTGGVAPSGVLTPRSGGLVRTIPTLSIVSTGLRGRVVDQTGRGIAGAVVTLVPAGTMSLAARQAATKTGTTTSTGDFTVRTTPGTYDVTVSATGYTDMNAAGVVVGPTGLSDGGLVTMPPVVDAAAAAAAEEAARVAEAAAAAAAEEAARVAEAAAAAAEAERQRREALAKAEAEKPWYKSPLVWVLGGAVVIGGGYLVWRSMQEKKA